MLALRGVRKVTRAVVDPGEVDVAKQVEVGRLEGAIEPGRAGAEQHLRPDARQHGVGVLDHHAPGQPPRRSGKRHLALGDADQIAFVEVEAEDFRVGAPVFRRERVVETVRQRLGERRLAARFGTEHADALDEMRADDVGERAPVRKRIGADRRAGDGHGGANRVTGDEARAHLLGKPRAVGLGCEDNVDGLGMMAADDVAPNWPEIDRIVLGLLRQDLIAPEHARVWKQFAHPLRAQQAGDVIVRQAADQDGELPHLPLRELAEEHVPVVRRHELAEHETAVRQGLGRHAGRAPSAASARMALRHSCQPQNTLKKRPAYRIAVGHRPWLA